MDELIPQKQIEEQLEEYSLGDYEDKKLNELTDRLRCLQIKFEANKIQRDKEYGR